MDIDVCNGVKQYKLGKVGIFFESVLANKKFWSYHSEGALIPRCSAPEEFGATNTLKKRHNSRNSLKPTVFGGTNGTTGET